MEHQTEHFTARRLPHGGRLLEIRKPQAIGQEEAREILGALDPVLRALREHAGLAQQEALDLPEGA